MFYLNEYSSDFLRMMSIIVDKNKENFLVDMQERDGELWRIHLYPYGDSQDFIRLSRADVQDGFVHVFIDGERACRVDAEHFGYNVQSMIAYGRTFVECRAALYGLNERLKNMANMDKLTCELPYSVKLGRVFNRFIIHSCEGVFHDHENGRLFFDVRDEALPNDWTYCLNYREWALEVVDNNDEWIVRLPAYDLCESFINDAIDAQEV